MVNLKSCVKAAALWFIAASGLAAALGCVEAHVAETPTLERDVSPPAVPVPNENEGRLVEWDMWFPDQASQDAYYDSMIIEKGGVFTELASGNWLTWDWANAVDLRYCVTEDFADYERAVDEMAIATAEWEERANITFKHVVAEDDDCDANNANVDFAVGITTYSTIFGTLMGCGTPSFDDWEGSLPAGLCPTGSGNEAFNGVLLLNYVAIDANTGSDWTSLGVIRHELGHVLGLRHEFAFEPGEDCENIESAPFGGVHLTEYDEDSVMQYPGSCGIPEGDFAISSLDGVALRELYGMPVSWYAGGGLI